MRGLPGRRRERRGQVSFAKTGSDKNFAKSEVDAPVASIRYQVEFTKRWPLGLVRDTDVRQLS